MLKIHNFASLIIKRSHTIYARNQNFVVHIIVVVLQIYLHIRQCSNSRQRLSFQKFKTCTTSGGNMRNLISQSCLIDGSNRVTSSHNGDCTSFCCVSQHLCNRVRSFGKVAHFEDTHWTIPYNSSALFDFLFKLLNRFRPNIKSHPITTDVSDLCNSTVCIIVKFICYNNVYRKDNFDSFCFSFFQEGSSQIHDIFFYQRPSSFVAECSVECEDHTTSNQNCVAFFQQGFNDRNFCRNLCSADNGHHWFHRFIDSSLQIFEFLVKQKSCCGLLHEFSDSGSTAVCAMSSSKGVHDKVIGHFTHSFRQCLVILRLTDVKTSVFQQQHLSLSEVTSSLFGFGSDDSVNFFYRSSKKFFQRFDDGIQSTIFARFNDFTLGSTKMAHQNNVGALVEQKFGGRNDSTQSCIVCDSHIILGKRYVQIHSNQDILPLKINLLRKTFNVQFFPARRGSMEVPSKCSCSVGAAGEKFCCDGGEHCHNVLLSKDFFTMNFRGER
mmetsp:Transcript_26735/g.73536  ORF Transcript_26735/g.73536 Transcript_26735/m.73536 type:complete len:494 (+) Transcript_26735:84-1565(+)